MATNLEKDPVCGMMIDPATAAGKSDYMGKTYYFCATGCKTEFDADPAKYTSGEAVGAGMGMGMGGGKKWWEFWKK